MGDAPPQNSMACYLGPFWRKVSRQGGGGPIVPSLLPETFEEQSAFSRKRRMWTIVVAAMLTTIIAIQFSTDDSSIMTRSGIPFHYVLWAIVALDLIVAIQWYRVIENSGRIEQRPGGW